ncbi:MAG: gamma-glutamylcyclotransferase [Pseudooceanicola sp.]|nr:gamma-glutamylcyclotransferase [Pseudooceanicola sp.]
MRDPWFFGYGSLVNRATHDYPAPRPARLDGWARAWRHTSLRDVAFLTAVRAPGVAIEGLIAAVPRGDWAALDAREWAYERLVAQDVAHDMPDALEIAVYAVPEAHQAAPDVAHPILLSYLDVVVQGYLREFGVEGVDRFFATTTGWDAPILDDRAAPRYPRAQVLTAQETALVDSRLARIGAMIV